MVKEPIRKLYRDKNGLLLGVCLGFARYRDIPVFWLRLAVLLLILCTGIWAGTALYILAAVLIRPEPPQAPPDLQGDGFYTRFAGSRAAGLHELGERLNRLGERIRGMEDKVTRQDFDWENRLRGRKPKGC